MLTVVVDILSAVFCISWWSEHLSSVVGSSILPLSKCIVLFSVLEALSNVVLVVVELMMDLILSIRIDFVSADGWRPKQRWQLRNLHIMLLSFLSFKISWKIVYHDTEGNLMSCPYFEDNFYRRDVILIYYEHQWQNFLQSLRNMLSREYNVILHVPGLIFFSLLSTSTKKSFQISIEAFFLQRIQAFLIFCRKPWLLKYNK